MYEIKLASSAAKYYKKVDTGTRKILNRCFDNLKADPENHSNIKKLHGKLKGLYRYRIGQSRIVYKVDEDS